MLQLWKKKFKSRKNNLMKYPILLISIEYLEALKARDV